MKKTKDKETGVVILTPKEGYQLTDGVTYSDKVYLSKFSDGSEWEEVKIEEEEKTEE